MHITLTARGATPRVCDTADDKLAGAWVIAEIKRLMKAGVREHAVTVAWRNDTASHDHE